jgi:hypothetical protein
MGVPNEFATVQRIFAEYPQYVKPYNKAASAYLTRLIAVALNPSGDPKGWGLLAKPPGENNVDGYAIDAIIWGETNEVVDIITNADGSRPGPSWQPGGKPRSTNYWAPPTLSGRPPGPGPDDGDDGDDGGSDGDDGSGRPVGTGGKGGTGAMPRMPSGLRPEAYKVGEIVADRMMQLGTVPLGIEDFPDEVLQDWQVEGTRLAVSAIAAVAADWAIEMAIRHVKDKNGSKSHTSTELDELDARINDTFE